MASYYLVAGAGKSVYLRYMIPMIPLLCMAAGVGLVTLIQRVKNSAPSFAVLGAGLLIAAPTALASWRHNQLLAGPDTRQLAARWVVENIPAGSTLALTGSDYGYPRLSRSRLWLEHARDDQRRNGHDASRLSLRLALKDYPIEPSYYVFEIRPDNPQALRTVLETEWPAQVLYNAGVEWVITQEHSLIFSQLAPRLRKTLSESAQLVASFDPFTPGTKKPPFDPIDAFYSPIGEFSAARYSGPMITIYQLRGTELGQDYGG